MQTYLQKWWIWIIQHFVWHIWQCHRHDCIFSLIWMSFYGLLWTVVDGSSNCCWFSFLYLLLQQGNRNLWSYTEYGYQQDKMPSTLQQTYVCGQLLLYRSVNSVLIYPNQTASRYILIDIGNEILLENLSQYCSSWRSSAATILRQILQ
jgi:hypothetical protein